MATNRFLVIDDDQEQRNLAISLLMAEWPSAKILFAPDGQRGLEISRKELPTMIITDWQMPKMDGIELLHQLKQDGATEGIPVIMMTGVMTDSENLREVLDLGAIDFLRKPMVPTEFIARVRSVIRMQQYMKEKYAAELALSESKTANAKAESQQKSSEIVTLTAMATQRRNFLQEIRKHVTGMIDQGPSATGQASATDVNTGLATLSALLDGELESDQYWTSVRMKVDQLHDGFLERLAKKYSELTRKDLEYCALLKLNLGTKEVAEVLRVSEGAIEKRRNRLRKRMGIEAGGSIERFLMNL